MSHISPHDEIARTFDRFVDAFSTFDGKAVASLFIAPGVALRRDGSLKGFSAQHEIETYYQAALDRYQASGCRSCRYVGLVVRFLTDNSAIATVSWELVGSSDAVTDRWSQAYFMVRIDGEWRIYGSSFAST